VQPNRIHYQTLEDFHTNIIKICTYTQNNNRNLLFIIIIITIVLSVHRWLCLLLLCLFFCEDICPTFKILIGAEQDLIFFFFVVSSFSHFLLFLMNKNFINQNMEKCLIMVIFKPNYEWRMYLYVTYLMSI